MSVNKWHNCLELSGGKQGRIFCQLLWVPKGVVKIIHPFDGNPMDIEKYALFTRVQADQVKMVTCQASKGPVSNFLKGLADDLFFKRTTAKHTARVREWHACSEAVKELLGHELGQAVP